MPRDDDELIPEEVIARARDASIADAASRHVQWDKQKTVAARGDYWACCPFHEERTPSFHVRENNGSFKCFGCKKSGNVIDLVMELERVNFPEAVRRLTGEDSRDKARRYVERKPVDEISDPQKLAAALVAWESAAPIAGTIAEMYLRNRGVTHDLSDADLRFSQFAPEGYKLKRGKCPAMIAAIRKPCGQFIGAHLTYLLPDGAWKRTSQTHFPDRRVLAKKDGGFIKLAPFVERMTVGEGIESSFSAAQISGRAPLCAVTSENLAKLPLIPGVRDYLIAYDRDAKHQGKMAGRELAIRVREAGLVARGYPPPADVKDWNDVAQRRA